MSTELDVRSPVKDVNFTKVNSSKIYILMQRRQKKIKTENLEGLILCLTIELGLYSVNY